MAQGILTSRRWVKIILVVILLNNNHVFADSFDTTLVNKLVVSGTISGTNPMTLGDGTDLRVTGSTHLLGALDVNQNKLIIDANGIIHGTNPVTIGNGIDLRITGSTHLLGALDVNQNKLIIDVNGVIHGTSPVAIGYGTDFRVTGSTHSLGAITIGNTQIIGENTSVVSIDNVTPTSVLTINFSNLAGSSSPLKKGARVSLHCIVAGNVGGTDSVNFYNGDLIVSPGATGGNSCTIVTINETTNVAVGSAVTLTSGISGTGTAATITLLSSSSMSSQSVVLFYEVRCDNVSNVA